MNTFKFIQHNNKVAVIVNENDTHIDFINIYDIPEGLWLDPVVDNIYKKDLIYKEFDKIDSFKTILERDYPEILI